MATKRSPSLVWPGSVARRLGLLTLLAATSLPLVAVSPARAQGTAASGPGAPWLTRDEVRAVAPALERYAAEALFGDLWRRPDLSPRDRSLVTLSARIARNATVELPRYLDLALDSGVRPGEVSEVVTHLAFYAGWGNAMAAVPMVRDAFARRGVGADGLPPAESELLPLDQAAEAERAARVGQQVGPVVPGLDRFTTDVLFRDLWLRPGLAPRDRSLVTVSALVASGQFAQLGSHLNRAMDNGLTRAQASEAVTHLAFYAGWPNAFSAVPVLKGVFEGRPD
jgi:4-carboxymuconolactone decarboxylase